MMLIMDDNLYCYICMMLNHLSWLGTRHCKIRNVRTLSGIIDLQSLGLACVALVGCKITNDSTLHMCNAVIVKSHPISVQIQPMC